MFNQLNDRCSIVVQFLEKKKIVVQSIEWDTFNCLNNKNKKENVLFNQLKGNCSIV